MEGRPRDQERPEEPEDDGSDSSKKKKRRFRPPLSSYLDKPKDGTEEESRSWWPKYERINRKKDARPLIPELNPVEEVSDAPEADQSVQENFSEESRLETESPQDFDTHEEDNAGREPVPEANVPHEAEHKKDTDQFELPTIPERQEDAQEAHDTPLDSTLDSEKDDTTVDSNTESEQPSEFNESTTANQFDEEDSDSVEDLADDPELEPGLDPDLEQTLHEEAASTPDPESVEEILHRNRRERYAAIPVEPPEVSRGTVINNFNTNETHNHYTNPNTGLHLLNYALARRRDSRDRHEANKKFQATNTRIDTLEQRLNQEKVSNELLKKQQKELQNNRIMETVFDRNKDIKINPVDKNATAEIEKTMFESPRSMHTNIGSLDRNRNPAIQNYDIAPEQRNAIVSEALYERQHEVKDISSLSQTSGGQAMGTQDSVTTQVPHLAAQRNYTNKSEPIDLSKIPKTQNLGVKDAVVTGTWGAVVGLILFIIFYMLTRG